MIIRDPDIVVSPARQHRVTLRKTVISCALLACALLLAIVLMSLIGSEPFPSALRYAHWRLWALRPVA